MRKMFAIADGAGRGKKRKKKKSVGIISAFRCPRLKRKEGGNRSRDNQGVMGGREKREKGTDTCRPSLSKIRGDPIRKRSSKGGKGGKRGDKRCVVGVPTGWKKFSVEFPHSQGRGKTTTRLPEMPGGRGEDWNRRRCWFPLKKEGGGEGEETTEKSWWNMVSKAMPKEKKSNLKRTLLVGGKGNKEKKGRGIGCSVRPRIKPCHVD